MPHPHFQTQAETPHTLGRDLIAGVVVFLVALPLCLGIAQASGATAISGLISGVVGGLVVAALSRSPVSVSGPAAGLAAIVAVQIKDLGFDGFLLAVMIAGALQVVLGAVRGGQIANFVPNNVLKGLLAAIGILLILKQFPHLIGHDSDYEGDEAFVQKDGDNTFTALWTALQRLLPGAAIIGFASLAVLVAWDKSRLKKSVVPGPLVAVLLGVVINEILVATGSGLAIVSDPSDKALVNKHLVNLPVLGENGLGLAGLVQFPAFGRLFEPAVWIAGVTLAIVASLETLLNLEATEKLDPLRRPSEPNRELLAQGAGNLLAGLFGGLPMTSVIVRSSVNVNAGGRTRWSAITHGALLLVAVLFFAALLNRIPNAALAAVLIVTGFKLAHPSLFVQKWQAGWLQFTPFLATVVAIVFTDLLIGVLVGLAVSLSFVFGRNLRGGFRVIRESHVGGVVHRIEFSHQASFLNRARLLSLLARFQEGDHVALDARQSEYVDSDLLSLVREFATESAPARGIKVSLLGFQDRYELDDVVQYVDYTSREVQATLKPQQVLQILREGNERFVSGNRLNRDLARQVDATKSSQHPMAIVVSCIDSRAPAELLFDVGIGDIFSCRLAGNVARRKALGSIEFACKVAGSRLVVVLGHTSCGAVKATCEFVGKGVDPASTGLTNLAAITSVIGESVHEEMKRQKEADYKDPAFVDRVTATHVGHTLEWLIANSPTLQAMLKAGEIGLVGAMYDITTGRVEFLPRFAHGVAAVEVGSPAVSPPVA